MKICTVEDCNYPVFGKGFCKTHQYLRKDIKKSVKKTSDKMLVKLKEYRIVRDKYMTEHPTCEFPECTKPSEDLHHVKRRIGDNLTNVEHFKALCRLHHIWVEENPLEAKKLNLL